MLVRPACAGRPIRHGKSKNKKLNSPQGDERKGHPSIRVDDLFVFLESRRDKLDAVVITGGEPTIQDDLEKFFAKIKKLGYLIKLDTNGTNPEMLARLIKKRLVDYLAMDIKAPAQKYKKVTGGKALNFANIKKSVKIIRESELPYEFRTTVVPRLLNKADIEKIGKIIKSADKWYLQQFKSNIPLVNRQLVGKKAYSQKELEAMAEIGRKYVKKCEVR